MCETVQLLQQCALLSSVLEPALRDGQCYKCAVLQHTTHHSILCIWCIQVHGCWLFYTGCRHLLGAGEQTRQFALVHKANRGDNAALQADLQVFLQQRHQQALQLLKGHADWSFHMCKQRGSRQQVAAVRLPCEGGSSAGQLKWDRTYAFRQSLRQSWTFAVRNYPLMHRACSNSVTGFKDQYSMQGATLAILNTVLTTGW